MLLLWVSFQNLGSSARGFTCLLLLPHPPPWHCPSSAACWNWALLQLTCPCRAKAGTHETTRVQGTHKLSTVRVSCETAGPLQCSRLSAALKPPCCSLSWAVGGLGGPQTPHLSPSVGLPPRQGRFPCVLGDACIFGSSSGPSVGLRGRGHGGGPGALFLERLH